MEELLISKTKGLTEEIEYFANEIMGMKDIDKMLKRIDGEMKYQNYDYVEEKEKIVCGEISGIKKEGSFYLISDLGQGIEANGIHNGVITSIFVGALIKRCLLPLRNDLNVIISAEEIEKLFQKISFKGAKGIIICKPTNYQIYKINKEKDNYEKLNGYYSFVHTLVSTLEEERYETVLREKEMPVTTTIPIVEFGGDDTFEIEKIEKTIYIITKVVVRCVGFPLFGWSADEI